MEAIGEKLEQREDSNAIYTLYKNTDTTVETTYFFIADLKNKEGFFSFEVQGELETLKPIYDKIKVK